ncbi:hypothetical protein BH18ACI3_BH18ACI3_07040 [soil metagenome]
MNVVSTILILIAIVLTLLTLLALIGWLSGVDNVLLPGLGLIVSVPILFVLLLILDTGVIIVAALVKTSRNVSRMK